MAKKDIKKVDENTNINPKKEEKEEIDTSAKAEDKKKIVKKKPKKEEKKVEKAEKIEKTEEKLEDKEDKKEDKDNKKKESKKKVASSTKKKNLKKEEGKELKNEEEVNKKDEEEKKDRENNKKEEENIEEEKENNPTPKPINIEEMAKKDPNWKKKYASSELLKVFQKVDSLAGINLASYFSFGADLTLLVDYAIEDEAETAFSIALSKFSLQDIKFLIDVYKVDLTKPCRRVNGFYLHPYAIVCPSFNDDEEVFNRKKSIIEYFIEKGIDINSTCEYELVKDEKTGEEKRENEKNIIAFSILANFKDPQSLYKTILFLKEKGADINSSLYGESLWSMVQRFFPFSKELSELFKDCPYNKEIFKVILTQNIDFSSNKVFSKNLIWLMRLYNDGEDLLSTDYNVKFAGTLDAKTSVFAMTAYNAFRANRLESFKEKVGGIANNDLDKIAFIFFINKEDEADFDEKIKNATADSLLHYLIKDKDDKTDADKIKYTLTLKNLLLDIAEAVK